MAIIYVVGLGSGDLSSMPLGVLERLKSGLPVFLRTKQHPGVSGILQHGIVFETFDSIYETSETFVQVYRQIADRLVAEARRQGDIVYAVPGHPLVAEQSVQNLLELKLDDVCVQIESGQSFLDAVLKVVSIDPIEGFLLLDGTSLNSDQLAPSMHTLLAQVYNREVASDVKLTLMDVYPDDYAVKVIRAAGVRNQERVETIPMYQLDRLPWIDHLTTVYIPKTAKTSILARDSHYVEKLVHRLRGPGGCPWDKAQTHLSLRPYAIEEAYEVADAIDRDNLQDLTQELGDLYLQVLLHAEIASEKGDFDLRDVYSSLANKLIRRHPHVFGTVKAGTAEEAEISWQAAKAAETASGGDRGAVDSPSTSIQVKRGQPAFWRAVEVQKCAAKLGFDWTERLHVLEKVKEEINEIEEELKVEQLEHAREELGDLLFAAVNLARWIDIDPETALVAATRKFEQRFAFVEQCVENMGNNWLETSPEQLNLFWKEAKIQNQHKN